MHVFNENFIVLNCSGSSSAMDDILISRRNIKKECLKTFDLYVVPTISLQEKCSVLTLDLWKGYPLLFERKIKDVLTYRSTLGFN